MSELIDYAELQEQVEHLKQTRDKSLGKSEQVSQELFKVAKAKTMKRVDKKIKSLEKKTSELQDKAKALQKEFIREFGKFLK